MKILVDLEAGDLLDDSAIDWIRKRELTQKNWVIVDQCDLAMAGNEQARRMLPILLKALTPAPAQVS